MSIIAKAEIKGMAAAMRKLRTLERGADRMIEIALKAGGELIADAVRREIIAKGLIQSRTLSRSIHVDIRKT